MKYQEFDQDYKLFKIKRLNWGEKKNKKINIPTMMMLITQIINANQPQKKYETKSVNTIHHMRLRFL